MRPLSPAVVPAAAALGCGRVLTPCAQAFLALLLGALRPLPSMGALGTQGRSVGLSAASAYREGNRPDARPQTQGSRLWTPGPPGGQVSSVINWGATGASRLTAPGGWE